MQQFVAPSVFQSGTITPNGQTTYATEYDRLF